MLVAVRKRIYDVLQIQQIDVVMMLIAYCNVVQSVLRHCAVGGGAEAAECQQLQMRVHVIVTDERCLLQSDNLCLVRC